MATKSFLKNVDIREKKATKNLIQALEHSKDKGRIDVQLSRTCSDATKEQIRTLFGKRA